MSNEQFTPALNTAAEPPHAQGSLEQPAVSTPAPPAASQGDGGGVHRHPQKGEVWLHTKTLAPLTIHNVIGNWVYAIPPWTHLESCQVWLSVFLLEFTPADLIRRKAPAAPDGGVDDPVFDGTDAAHPAWWRAHEHTAAVFCRKVNDILDGKDDGSGGNHEPWGATRKRLLDLVSRAPAPATAEWELGIAKWRAKFWQEQCELREKWLRDAEAKLYEAVSDINAWRVSQAPRTPPLRLARIKLTHYRKVGQE